jgi:hypothetical protein
VYALSACQPTSRMTSSKQLPWIRSSFFFNSEVFVMYKKLLN